MFGWFSHCDWVDHRWSLAKPAVIHGRWAFHSRPRRASRSVRATQEPGGEAEGGFDQFEQSVNRDANQAEWEHDQLDDRIEDQGDQRQRPAHDEQDEPEQKLDHKSSVGASRAS